MPALPAGPTAPPHPPPHLAGTLPLSRQRSTRPLSPKTDALAALSSAEVNWPDGETRRPADRRRHRPRRRRAPGVGFGPDTHGTNDRSVTERSLPRCHPHRPGRHPPSPSSTWPATPCQGVLGAGHLAGAGSSLTDPRVPREPTRLGSAPKEAIERARHPRSRPPRSQQNTAWAPHGTLDWRLTPDGRTLYRHYSAPLPHQIQWYAADSHGPTQTRGREPPDSARAA